MVQEVIMEKKRNVLDFSDDELVKLYQEFEKRILNMEKLTEEETVFWNEMLAEMFRRDLIG